MSKCPYCGRNPIDRAPKEEIYKICDKHGLQGEMCNPGGRELIFPFGSIQLMEGCRYCDLEKLTKEIKKHKENKPFSNMDKMKEIRDKQVRRYIIIKEPTVLLCGDIVILDDKHWAITTMNAREGWRILLGLHLVQGYCNDPVQLLTPDLYANAEANEK